MRSPSANTEMKSRPGSRIRVLGEWCRVLENPADAFDECGESIRLTAIDVQELVGELAELRAIRRGHVHEVRDHANRQRSSERRHDIDRRAGLELVEQLGDRRANEGPPLLDGRGSEVLMQQATHVAVARWILLHQLSPAESPHFVEQR
jgi:hypothetical protein